MRGGEAGPCVTPQHPPSLGELGQALLTQFLPRGPAAAPAALAGSERWRPMSRGCGTGSSVERCLIRAQITRMISTQFS